MEGSGSKKSKKEKKHSKRDREETGSAAPETSDLSFLLGGEASSFEPGLASLFDASKAKAIPVSEPVAINRRGAGARDKRGNEVGEDLSDDGAEAEQERAESALLKKKKTKKTHPEPDPAEEAAKADRTVFVGGVPVATIKQDKLAKYFSKFGTVESVRFRSIAMAKMSNPKMRRVGYITNDFNEKQETCNAYVVFADKASVVLALSENGKDDFSPGFHLRVDHVEPTISHKKSVFVGNLPFTVSEKQLRDAFLGADCGSIEYVRVVRDKVTSLGRGYAYVCFEKREGAKKAAELTDLEVAGRKVRIERCKKPGDEKRDDSAVKKARTAPPPQKKHKIGKPQSSPAGKPAAPAKKMPQRQKKKLNKAKAQGKK